MPTARFPCTAPYDAFHGVNSENWPAHREAIAARIRPYLGEPSNLDPAYRVTAIVEEEEIPHADGRLTRIAYETEPGEVTRAFLLVPHGVTAPAPTILCLHGTNDLAKDTMIWSDPKKPNRHWATQLCRQGFVTFSPDHVSAGERCYPGLRPYFTTPFYERHPDWSEMGKMAWDASRALDALALCGVADMKSVGAVGHSLGGYGSIQSAAFDTRIKAAVSSCGFTTWEGNEKRFKWARQEDYYRHFPALHEPFSREEIPFELYELAALIAPRALLNLSGMEDAMYGLPNNASIPEAGRRMAALWSQAGNPEGFANFLFGAGHDVPIYCTTLVAGWFRRWLCDEAVVR